MTNCNNIKSNFLISRGKVNLLSHVHLLCFQLVSIMILLFLLFFISMLLLMLSGLIKQLEKVLSFLFSKEAEHIVELLVVTSLKFTEFLLNKENFTDIKESALF